MVKHLLSLYKALTLQSNANMEIFIFMEKMFSAWHERIDEVTLFIHTGRIYVPDSYSVGF